MRGELRKNVIVQERLDSTSYNSYVTRIIKHKTNLTDLFIRVIILLLFFGFYPQTTDKLNVLINSVVYSFRRRRWLVCIIYTYVRVCIFVLAG